MNLIDHALTRAHLCWDVGAPLPIDLFYELIGLGLDVETLERKHRAESF